MARAKRTQVQLKNGRKVFCLVQTDDDDGSERFSFNRGETYLANRKEALKRAIDAGTLHYVPPKGEKGDRGGRAVKAAAPFKNGKGKAQKTSPTTNSKGSSSTKPSKPGKTKPPTAKQPISKKKTRRSAAEELISELTSE